MGTYDALLEEYIHFLYSDDSLSVIPIYYTSNVDIHQELSKYHTELIEYNKIKARTKKHDFNKLESIHAKYNESISKSRRLSIVVYAYGKHDAVERKIVKYATKKPLIADLTANELDYENNKLTKDLYDEKSYTDYLMDPAISTSLTSNLNACMFTIETETNEKQRKRYYELFTIVASTLHHYGIPRHDSKYRYTYEQMRDKPYYIVPWANSAIEMLMSVNNHDDFVIARELITYSFSNRSTLAKIVSSPMSIMTALLDINGTFITDESLQLQYSSKMIKALVTDEAKKELEEMLQKMIDLGLVDIPNILLSWIENPRLDTFHRVANVYSWSFHVGYRKQLMQDAVQDQLSVEYSENVDKTMYDEYYNYIKEDYIRMLKDDVIKSTTILKQHELAGLLSMSSASNGKKMEIKFGSKKLFTTRKNMHVMSDVSSGNYNSSIVPPVDATSPIPLGRRDVPGRRTRVIFILPYEYFLAQHAIVELLLKQAKHTREFSEFYSSANQLLSYGDTMRELNPSTIIIYTDVSQWDGSQHNTQPFRKAIMAAMQDLQAYTTDQNVERALNKYYETQRQLMNSYVTIDDKIIQYGAVASGEKQTKIANSIANLALIKTVLNKLSAKYTFNIKLIRVDGDDNYTVIESRSQVTQELLSNLSKDIKDTYALMNVKVKALVSTTGLEMAKRYIAGGRIYFRAGINILNNEKRNQQTAWDQAAILYASYTVNKLRGFITNRTFILTKIMQMTSVKISGVLRIFPASDVLTLNSTYKVFDEVDYAVNYKVDADSLMLQKLLIKVSQSRSKVADEISKSHIFSNYVKYISTMLLKIPNKTIEQGLAKTEKAKLNSYPPISLEKRKTQLDTLIKTLQYPIIYVGGKTTLNDVVSVVDQYVEYKSIDPEKKYRNYSPMLPTDISEVITVIGSRLSSYEDHAGKSAIAKLISTYSVYRPSIEELYAIITKRENEIKLYMLSLSVPLQDVDAYIASQTYKRDKYLILQSYVYDLLSINYGAYQLFDFESEFFSKYITYVAMSKVPSAEFLVGTYVKLKIINRYLTERKWYSANITIPKHEYMKINKLTWEISSVRSPYTSANFFQE
ncbi:VP1 [Rotavirus F chicken/03V0568/DEU/2003]|uniref:RNA-directed RNA polymerase n=1 Tax=Rotavirus F chicken/03V0568/DEU/2003 TaxID=994994 RepID=I6QGT9_9REOV|nr:VP1 [Rotavirus F chicken/03V0568/DEU/2003]AFK65656.1 VP1 [Rotavirus F chicken/03V0568/DEU/2003]